MKNRYIFVSATIIILGVVTTFVLLSNKKTTPTVTLSNTGAGQLSQLKLNDICHCYAVIGSMGMESMFDTKTLQPVSSEMFPSIGAYFETSLSPSRKAMVAIKNNSIWYQSNLGQQAKKIYTADTDETIGFPQWSTDEKYIVIGVQFPEDRQPAEGLWASTLRLIRLSDGMVNTIITRDQSLKQGMKNLFAYAISNNGKTVWFSSGDMDIQKSYAWSSKTHRITELRNVYYSNVYVATTDVNGHSVFLSVKDNKLHQYDVDSDMDTILPLILQGDAPVSAPSPDGKNIIVLLYSDGQAFGTPAIYDLSTAKYTILTDTTLPTTQGLTGVVWSPDSLSVLFRNDMYPKIQYFFLSANKEHQTAQIVADVPTTDELPYLYALLPLPSITD